MYKLSVCCIQTDNLNAPMKMKYCSMTHLSAVGQVIHRKRVVKAEAKSKITEATREVILHQDVRALQISVDDGHFGPPARGVVTMQMSHTLGQWAPEQPQVLPADEVSSEVLLQVSAWMIGGDQPVLLLHLPLLSCQEVQDVLMLQINVRKYILFILPGCILFIGEDLHRHRFELFWGALPQLGFVHLCEASLANLKVQLDGQRFCVVVEVVGMRGAAVRAVVVHHDGAGIATVQRAFGALAFFGRLFGLPLIEFAATVHTIPIEGGDDQHSQNQEGQQTDKDHQHHLVICRVWNNS